MELNLQPDLQVLRQAHARGWLRRSVWTGTEHMAADGLTKELTEHENEVLREFGRGMWKLVTKFVVAPSLCEAFLPCG